MNSSRRIHLVKAMERFPTKARADGRFQKRILGHLFYFGADNNRDLALAEYDRIKHDLYAGRRPRPAADTGAITLKELANLFTDEQEARHDAGEITIGHLKDYQSSIRKFLKVVGTSRLVSDLRPEDFANFSRYMTVTKKYAVGTFNRERACIVAMFNHAERHGWIKPVAMGDFKKRSDTTRKRRYFEPTDVRKLLAAAPDQLKAMILLGVNGGFGATDCALLRWDEVDLKKRRILTIRRKRKTIRNITLWPETIAALKAVKVQRPHGEFVFDREGKPWVNKSGTDNDVTRAFAALVDELKIPRPAGVSFGALRHTFATLANRRQDSDAYKRIMGHKLTGLDETYVEDIEWPRLKRVTDHVRSRIFSSRRSGPSRT